MDELREPEELATLAQYRAEFRRRFNLAFAGIDGRITSYYRSPADNRRVGGAPRSLHLYGLAADVVPASHQRSKAIRQARQAGLFVLDEGDHLHVGLWSASQRPKGFLA